MFLLYFVMTVKIAVNEDCVGDIFTVLSEMFELKSSSIVGKGNWS